MLQSFTFDSSSCVLLAKLVLNWLDPEKTKTREYNGIIILYKKSANYKPGPPCCNFAYTRAIKGDIGFQDPFVAFSEPTKVTGNRLFEAWK